MATPPEQILITRKDSDTTPPIQWRQLLVTVGDNPLPVYLDTSLQGLLYGPDITEVDSNLATQFHFGRLLGDTGPFLLRNRVTPTAAPVFSGNPPVYDIQLLPQSNSTQQVYQHRRERDKFAIYAEVPNNPDQRIYFRPTTPERTGLPRKNQILGHQIPRSQWDVGENFVFQPGSFARSDVDLPPASD